VAFTSHRYLADAGMGDSRDPLGRYTIIGNPIMIAYDSVYGDRVIKDSRHVRIGQDMAGNFRIAEIFCRDKSVTTGSESKIEVKSHGMATVIETQSWPETRHRGEWRPATIIVGIPPGYP